MSSATPRLSQAVTSRGRSGYRYVILDDVMDRDQREAKRPPGGGVAFLSCGDSWK